jgi:hypothetical protein
LFRTAIIVARMPFHVAGFIIVSLGNMQPSQQMCWNFSVTFPLTSRIQNPAWCGMLSFPLGSSGRQCRPVLSCDPEPFTVASFCATWKSNVHGRSAAVSVASALSSCLMSSQFQRSGRMRSSGAL